MLKPLVLALALAATTAHAQTTPATSPATPAKKALVEKVLKLQQPAVEALARQLAEQPAMQLMQQAGPSIQRLPAEQREATAKDIQADARKYADEAGAIVRERAVKLAPSTVGVVLEERFTEDELKQIIAILESPVNRKFQAAGADMQRALGEKLVAETRPLIEPKVKALEASIVKRLDPAATAAPKK